MICSNCGSKASHIFSSGDNERCENCSELPTTSINKTDGIITRNSWRVRRQQSRYEGDIVRPHTYDKNKHREVINPDFVKLYGAEKTKEFFSEDQMKRDGFGKMPAEIKKIEKKNNKLRSEMAKDTIYSGSTEKAMGKFLKETEPAR